MKAIEPPSAPHVVTADSVAAVLDVRADAGLDSAQAIERLAQFGPNLLAVTPPRSPWRVLLAQFKGIMIVVLIGAALLATLVGSYKDALVILAVVVINALVGFYQEYRAERSLDALKSMLPVGSAFNVHFFGNRMLWISLGGTLVLQALAVHWLPASRLFGTTGMAWADWGIAAGVASSVLVLEEARKLGFRGLQRFRWRA